MFQQNSYTIYRCFHWMMWSAPALILVKFHPERFYKNLSGLHSLFFVCLLSRWVVVLFSIICQKIFSLILWPNIMCNFHSKWRGHVTLRHVQWSVARKGFRSLVFRFTFMMCLYFKTSLKKNTSRKYQNSISMFERFFKILVFHYLGFAYFLV